MKWEFEKLHEFLRDEEQALLEQLWEETRRKQNVIQGKMEQLAEESQALLNEAGLLQADLKEDDYTFLMVIPAGIHGSVGCQDVGGSQDLIPIFFLFSRPTRTANGGRSRSRCICGNLGMRSLLQENSSSESRRFWMSPGCSRQDWGGRQNGISGFVGITKSQIL